MCFFFFFGSGYSYFSTQGLLTTQPVYPVVASKLRPPARAYKLMTATLRAPQVGYGPRHSGVMGGGQQGTWLSRIIL